MENRFSPLAGVVLILVGALALGLNLGSPFLRLSVWPLGWLGLWRWWPLVVVAVGLLCILPPVLMRSRPGLGGLFIPGLPILTSGAILLLASVLGWWRVWKWLWPQELLALALGFMLAAAYTRRIWLVAPAIIIGLNGVVLQFCALTGLWQAWAVLWTVEPLAVGLSLLAISTRTHSAKLSATGLILCGMAGVGLIGMTSILPGWRLMGSLGAALLILAGLLLLAWGVVCRPLSPNSI